MTKMRLMGGVALTALALGFMSTSASAFDEVDWDWDAHINEYAKIKVDVDVYNDPAGVVQIEKLQVQLGDVEAESYVSDFHNYQPEGGWNFMNPHHGNDLDAVDDLPEVVSAATAVGNNQNIESEVAVLLHDGQFLAGGIGYHGIQPAEITATSRVWDIKNASVDSTATAVGNNISVDVSTGNSDNQVVIGDITQFAYADLSAKSSVHDVTLQNYTDLGKIARPAVNSVATAVGNNVNIRVGAPVAP